MLHIRQSRLLPTTVRHEHRSAMARLGLVDLDLMEPVDRATVDTGLRQLVVGVQRRRGFATTALHLALLGSGLVAAFAIGEITRTAAVARSSLHRLTVARGASGSLPMVATGLQFALAAAVGWLSTEVFLRPAADERPSALAVVVIAGVGTIAAASIGRPRAMGNRVPTRRGVRRTLVLTLTTLEHLHYGSDYPFTPEFAAAAARERLAEAGDPPGSLIDALRANTERLFPTVRSDRR